MDVIKAHVFLFLYYMVFPARYKLVFVLYPTKILKNLQEKYDDIQHNGKSLDYQHRSM